MYPSYEDIINNIKAIMDEKGMKQVVVAERSGFTPQEFSNLLNDRRKLLRVEHIPRIAKALDAKIETLFFNEKENDSSMESDEKIKNGNNELTQCFHCKRLIFKTDKYCMYCGKLQS